VIQRLLEVTKEKALRVTSVDLEQLSIEALAVLGFSEEIEFDYKSDPESFQIPVDKVLFRQVILNLFLNSIQATESKCVTEIKVNVCKKQNWVTIEVSDNGKGIPSDIQNRVFEPLYSSKKDGFGLGLSLCYELISKHKGSIEIKKSTPYGTTFLIRLPCS
jgi:signal transduction histidine kinase